MGNTKPVEEALAGMDQGQREGGDMRTVVAALRLAQGDPQAATVALGPVIDDSVPITNRFRLVDALLLDAIAKDALGDAAGASRSLERVCQLACGASKQGCGIEKASQPPGLRTRDAEASEAERSGMSFSDRES